MPLIFRAASTMSFLTLCLVSADKAHECHLARNRSRADLSSNVCEQVGVLNVHTVFFGCLVGGLDASHAAWRSQVVAAKFHDDTYRSNTYYAARTMRGRIGQRPQARVGGVTAKSLYFVVARLSCLPALSLKTSLRRPTSSRCWIGRRKWPRRNSGAREGLKRA